MIAWLDGVVHTFNPSSPEAEAGRTREFEVSPVFIESFRLAKTALWRPCFKNKNNENL